MAFPNHALIQFGGHLLAQSGTSEIWTCGIRVVRDSSSGGYLATPQLLATNLAGPLKNWFTSAGSGMHQSASLEFVKVNNIDPAGHYVDSVTHSATITTANGAGALTSLPVFLSLCATLETGVARGDAHRGRIYLPNATKPCTLGSQISIADRNSAASAVAGLLTAINTTVAESPTFRPTLAVVSKKGTWRPIIGVSVNDVYDYQSRRKNRTSGTRSAVTSF